MATFHRSPGLILLSLLALAGCSALAQAAAPGSTTAPAANLPLAPVRTVARPVITVRGFSSGLGVNPRGGYNWIGLFMRYEPTNDKVKTTVQLPSGEHYLTYQDTSIRPDAEWVVVDLQTGKSRIFDMPGFHSAIAPCQAGNGRLFFSVDYAHIYYYDPVDESIKIVGRVHDDLGELRTFYRLQLGPDGMIYGTSQSTNGVASVLRLNPDTLEYKLITGVGVPGRRDLTYGYSMGMAPPWVYVAVGQGQWELWAVNMDSGEKKMLAERIATDQASRVVVNGVRDGVCIAQLNGPPSREDVALLNGQIIARGEPGKLSYEPAPVSYPPLEWRKSKPVVAGPPPVIDAPRSGRVGADSSVTIYWRPAGDEGEWRTAGFTVQRAAPEIIESLTALPDGSLLGNVRMYSGWFRYEPSSEKCEFFGKGGPSRVKTTALGGKIYFAGYPNTTLYEYDPAKPWQDPLTNKAGANPHLIGSQGQGRSEAHYAVALTQADERIYTLGRRERWSTGTGLCCYIPARNEFIALGQANKDLHPVDIAALPGLKRIVVSGEKPDAKLLVYDLDLKEVGQIELRPGLANTGHLLPVSASQFVGWYELPGTGKSVLYLYDLAASKLVKSVELEGEVGPVFRRPSDDSYWLFRGQELARLDPATLAIQPLAQLERRPSLPLWSGQKLLGTVGGELVEVTLPKP